MTRPTPRRPASSRNVTPRPRKLAGQAPADGTVGEEAVTAEPSAEERLADEPLVDEPSFDEPADEADVDALPPSPEDGDGLLAGERTTLILIRVLAVLTVLLVLLAAGWLVHGIAGLNHDEPAPRDVPEGSIDVPSDRPIIPTELSVEEGVDAAQHAAQEMFALSYRTYDKDVTKAVALMTPKYADEFQNTADDVKSEFVRRKTTVDVRVRGQGVVRANDTELQALVFLDQFITRGQDQKTVISPYRVLITVVHTDHGWLVDDVDTK